MILVLRPPWPKRPAWWSVAWSLRRPSPGCATAVLRWGEQIRHSWSTYILYYIIIYIYIHRYISIYSTVIYIYSTVIYLLITISQPIRVHRWTKQMLPYSKAAACFRKPPGDFPAWFQLNYRVTTSETSCSPAEKCLLFGPHLFFNFFLFSFMDGHLWRILKCCTALSAGSTLRDLRILKSHRVSIVLCNLKNCQALISNCCTKFCNSWRRQVWF